MPSNINTFFHATRKGQIFLISILILQTALLGFIFLRLDDAASHRPMSNRTEPCIYPYKMPQKRLDNEDNCMPNPTRLSGRA